MNFPKNNFYNQLYNLKSPFYNHDLPIHVYCSDKCSSLTSYLPVTTAIGILQSPNFPSFYPENSNCIWNLTAPVGMAILLNFSIFQTEFCCDTLEVSRPNISQPGYSTIAARFLADC